MPIPVFFIAIIAASGLFGIGKTVKAGVDKHTANKVTADAKGILESAKSRLNIAKRKTNTALKNLGKKKASILATSINEFVREFEKLKNVNLKESDGLSELSKLKFDERVLKELKEMGSLATSIAGGAAGGALGGAMTAFAAWGLVTGKAFGFAASTGAALSGLSGAAATNATLAFFGGGSLASGGLGIAGGTAILGGLVAGPALAVLGLVVGAKATKQKEHAYANLAIAQKNAAEFNMASTLCDAISERCALFQTLLEDLDKRFKPLLKAMEDAINNNGTDFSDYSEESKKTVIATISAVVTIKSVLDTPILTKDGQLTGTSSTLLQKMGLLTSHVKSVKPERKVYHTKPQTDKLLLKSMIYACAYECYQEKTDNPKKSIAYGRIHWEKLFNMIKISYGIKSSPEDFGSSFDGYGTNEYLNLDSLQQELVKVICLYQVAYITQSCSSQDLFMSMTIDVEGIDWPSLRQKLLEIYGIHVTKGQLTRKKVPDGTISSKLLFERILKQIEKQTGAVQAHLLQADFFNEVIG